MQIPSQVKPAFWGAVAGAIILAVVGFEWGGWVTAGTAQQMASQKAQAAVVSTLLPYCVARFEQMPDAAAEWGKLKKTDSYDQSDFIEKAGVAGLPGSKLDSDTADALAGACASKLVAMKSLGVTKVSLNK